MSSARWSRLLAVVCLIAVGGCASPGSQSSPHTGARTPTAPKVLTVGGGVPVPGFGLWDIASAGHFFSVEGIHSVGITTPDKDGNTIGRLAERIPSFDDRTIVMQSDGRMQTTWKLRTGVKWHDGQLFSADDLAFTWRLYGDPDIPGTRQPVVRNMATLEAVAPDTLVITYRSTYYQALSIGIQEFWPLPKHLLAEPYETDKKNFVNLPFFNAEYVHLGPFRVVSFAPGESVVFERFDGYFLGRPRLDRIIFQAIPNPPTLFANLLAGSVDLATELSLTPNLLIDLRDEWRKSGGGAVLSRQGAVRYFKVQFGPEWGRPPELSRDPRIRQGLYTGLDRDSLREALFPGFPDTEADTYMLRKDPRGSTVGKPFARWAFDPARASQILAEAGWRHPDASGPPNSSGRGSDGRVVNPAGEVVQLPVRGDAAFFTEVEVAADGWRRLGLEVVEEKQNPQLASNPEYTNQFPGLTTLARGTGEGMFQNFDSRVIPTAQNGWSGGNRGGYANPAFDRIIDRVYGTLDAGQQAQALKEAGEVLAMELPMFPLYFRVELVAVAKGIDALLDDYPTAESRTLARHAHLWDRP